MRIGDLVIAGTSTLGGLIALTVPRRVIAWKRQRYAHRRVARWLRGRDTYFEEARQLAAYPPPSNPARVRLAGAALLALGIALASLSFHH